MSKLSDKFDAAIAAGGVTDPAVAKAIRGFMHLGAASVLSLLFAAPREDRDALIGALALEGLDTMRDLQTTAPKPVVMPTVQPAKGDPS